MASINQNAYTSALPNFRNLGILLRILLIVNVLAIGAAVVRAPTLAAAWASSSRFPRSCSRCSSSRCSRSSRSTVFCGVCLITSASPPSWRSRSGLTVALVAFAGAAYREALGPIERYVVLVLLTTCMLLAYFDLRGRALSPALAEARLQALQARIRPHFLFNSINAVLSLIRQEPRRAETALEDLADLFRVVMGDNRELSPIAREVELCRQYLDLEQLRLGDRLKVAWRIDKMPPDALVPPLVLQPLLENAVYHGIEPRVEPGEISIDIYSARNQVHAVLRNPYSRKATTTTRATRWRSPTSASACSCISMPRRRWRRASAKIPTRCTSSCPT